MVATSGNHFTLRNVRVHPAKTAFVKYYISIWSVLSILQPVVKLCHLAFTAVPPGVQRDPILRLSPSSNIYCHMLSTSMALQPFVRPWPLFCFLILYTFGRTPWTGIGLSQGRYLHIEQYKHRINAHRHPCLEWDSNPVFERAKTVDSLDREATVIGVLSYTSERNNFNEERRSCQFGQ
jgi:hypothetical protein